MWCSGVCPVEERRTISGRRQYFYSSNLTHLDYRLRHGGIEVDVADIFSFDGGAAELVAQFRMGTVRDDEEVALFCRAVCKGNFDPSLCGGIVDNLLVERHVLSARCIVQDLLQICPGDRTRASFDLQVSVGRTRLLVLACSGGRRRDALYVIRDL